MEPALQDAVEAQLAHLITVSWILLIPVGVLLTIVLFKLAFLLHTVSEFLGLARYEIFPILQLVQNTATNVEVLSSKAVAGVESVERGLQVTTPAVRKGFGTVKSSLGMVREGAQGVVSGLKRAFRR